MVRLLIVFYFFSILLFGCSNNNHAPVIEGWYQPAAKNSVYRVNEGDTLYSIAWAFGLDYRSLAAANHLQPPYRLHEGQVLKMTTTPSGVIETVAAPPITQSVAPKKMPVRQWVWPTRGRIIEGYSASPVGNKGINIGGTVGQSVCASANGVVVYSGAGVRGYGNLIIIKHNDSFLSAYAFNQRILVRQGQAVKAGQKIAEMGRDNAGRTMLHFEIRRNGIPINPLRELS